MTSKGYKAQLCLPLQDFLFFFFPFRSMQCAMNVLQYINSNFFSLSSLECLKDLRAITKQQKTEKVDVTLTLHLRIINLKVVNKQVCALVNPNEATLVNSRYLLNNSHNLYLKTIYPLRFHIFCIAQYYEIMFTKYTS